MDGYTHDLSHPHPIFPVACPLQLAWRRYGAAATSGFLVRFNEMITTHEAELARRFDARERSRASRNSVSTRSASPSSAASRRGSTSSFKNRASVRAGVTSLPEDYVHGQQAVLAKLSEQSSMIKAQTALLAKLSQRVEQLQSQVNQRPLPTPQALPPPMPTTSPRDSSAFSA